MTDWRCSPSFAMPSRMVSPGCKIDRLGLPAHADARRGAGGDDVARLQGHELADVADDLGHGEDHGAGVARLHALAVDVEPHVEALHVADLVAGHEPGADGAEGVAALALVPGAAALELDTRARRRR